MKDWGFSITPYAFLAAQATDVGGERGRLKREKGLLEANGRRQEFTGALFNSPSVNQDIAALCPTQICFPC